MSEATETMMIRVPMTFPKRGERKSVVMPDGGTDR